MPFCILIWFPVFNKRFLKKQNKQNWSTLICRLYQPSAFDLCIYLHSKQYLEFLWLTRFLGILMIFWFDYVSFLPGSSVVNKLPAMKEEGINHWVVKITQREHGKTLQYSCLEKSKDREAKGYSTRVTKSQRGPQLSMCTHMSTWASWIQCYGHKTSVLPMVHSAELNHKWYLSFRHETCNTWFSSWVSTFCS